MVFYFLNPGAAEGASDSDYQRTLRARQNGRGVLAHICSELAKVVVNIRALLVPDFEGPASIRLLVDNVEPVQKVLNELSMEHFTEKVIAAHMADRPGLLGRITRKLAEHGIDILLSSAR